MPSARPSQPFVQWMQQHCTPAERLSITGMLQDLDTYGLPLSDPDLIHLARAHPLVGRIAGHVDLFVLPERISVSLGRTRKIWFGIVQGQSGPPGVIGLSLVVQAWTADPSHNLVAVERQLMAAAQSEFP